MYFQLLKLTYPRYLKRSCVQCLDTWDGHHNDKNHKMSLVAQAKLQDECMCSMLKECKDKYKEFLAKDPYVTTMTICFFLSKAPISIDGIAEYVARPPTELGCSLIDEVFGGNERFYAKPRSKCFPNCIVFTLIEDGERKLAVKCFTNGALHITGVDTVNKGLEIAEMFAALLEIIEGGNGCGSLFQVERFELQLMNVHFKTNVGTGCIDLQKLFKLMLQRTQHLSSYNKERHNGLIIKLMSHNMHTVSVIVFDSGNILICACKDGDSFKEAYEFIIDTLKDVWQDVWQNDNLKTEVLQKAKRKRKDNFDYGQYIILS